MDKKKKRAITRGIILLLLVAAIIYTIYNTATKDEKEALQTGDAAPDFQLVDLDGNSQRLSNYKGQGVFLNFWGTWCEPCKREMPAIERQYQIYKDQGVQVLSINVAQSDFEVKKYVDQMDLSFPITIDKTKSVLSAYNVIPLPTTVLINPEGKVEKIKKGEMTEQEISYYMELIKPE